MKNSENETFENTHCFDCDTIEHYEEIFPRKFDAKFARGNLHKFGNIYSTKDAEAGGEEDILKYWEWFYHSFITRTNGTRLHHSMNGGA